MTEKRWLALILILFTGLGITFAIVTPVFEASDELWHYPMVRHLADGNSLPVQVFDPAQAGPWKQEASQPPLYYYLGAALTFWIDTSDVDVVLIDTNAREVRSARRDGHEALSEDAMQLNPELYPELYGCGNLLQCIQENSRPYIIASL